MTKQNAIKVFQEKKVRTVWDSDKEEWYFSIIDVIAVLTESDNPRRYWSDLKRKLTKEGSQLYAEIVQLKLPTAGAGQPDHAAVPVDPVIHIAVETDIRF